MTGRPANNAASFYAAVGPLTGSGCCKWTGEIFKKGGYGKLKWHCRTVQAHCVAWELVAGPVPDGMQVLHVCDDPPCVRNDDVGWYEVNGILRPRRGHLWIGTHQDNMADRNAKGRQAKGERNSHAKLTLLQVQEIRQEPLSTSTSFLAVKYRVARPTIARIRNGKGWR